MHSNFLAARYGFPDNEVVWPTGYDVIVSPRTHFFMSDSERATMTS